MVGLDANGYLFIYDEGNGMIRMMNVNDVNGVVERLVDGACRIDHLAPHFEAPFNIELRSMICYKTWLKRIVEVD